MATNIMQAKVKIKGVRPLLWHHFGPDALPLERQEKTGVADGQYLALLAKHAFICFSVSANVKP